MRPHVTRSIAAALVLILCRGAVDTGAARVIRDDRSGPANPAVEVGGHRLSSGPPPAIPYSLIGAIADEHRWFTDCAVWPWNLFGSISFRRHRITSRAPLILPPLP